MRICIPFVHSKGDCKLSQQYFALPTAVKIGLSKSSLASEFAETPIWIDPGFDFFHRPSKNTDSTEFYRTLDPSLDLQKASFHAKPDKTRIANIVETTLKACLQSRPAWISVPLLPFTPGASRRKINEALSTATSSFLATQRWKGKLVLPIIIPSRDMVNKKPGRTLLTQQVIELADRAGADTSWVVASYLNDDTGIFNLSKTHFPHLISLHQALRERLPESHNIVAGPYWGMNLVLTARGLTNYAAIGIGRGYQYSLTGGFVPKQKGKRRIAISGLRRLVMAEGDELADWLSHAERQVSGDPEFMRELRNLRTELPTLVHSEDKAKSQIVKFYSEWAKSIENVPQTGRALALYQDLSKAFVRGKLIGRTLPQSETGSKFPESVAQQLMLHCI